MSFPDHHPSSSFMLSPPSFAADDDSNGGWPQFQINNEHFDPHSTFDQLPSFKRARISENNHFNNPMPFPPTNNSRMHHPQNPPSNRGGTSHIFFKTRMCAKFKMGMCRNGENCNFAHGVEDMRQPPPNWQELIGLREEEQRPSGNWDDDQKIIHKMKLCKKYYNGEQCPYGERCNFLHEDPSKFRDDAGRCRESSAISLVANGSPKSHLNGSNNSDTNVNTGSDGSIRPNGKAPFFKIKLCTKWETTGHCPFADKCHFAHGQAELHGPIGQAEGVGSFPASTRATSVPVNDASPTNTASVPDSNEDEQNKKSLLKWKVNKKINRIYADWLDDVPLPR